MIGSSRQSILRRILLVGSIRRMVPIRPCGTKRAFADNATTINRHLETEVGALGGSGKTGFLSKLQYTARLFLERPCSQNGLNIRSSRLWPAIVRRAPSPRAERRKQRIEASGNSRARSDRLGRLAEKAPKTSFRRFDCALPHASGAREVFNASHSRSRLHAAELPHCYLASAVLPGQSSVRNGVNGSPLLLNMLHTGLSAHA